MEMKHQTLKHTKCIRSNLVTLSLLLLSCLRIWRSDTTATQHNSSRYVNYPANFPTFKPFD